MRSASKEPTHRLQRILLATDFSDAALRARDYAIALAGAGAAVNVVHAHPLPLPDWPEPAYVPDWMPAEPSVREGSLERLRLFATPVRDAGLSVQTTLREGLPSDVILALAAEGQPDLIAMGTHGHRRLERWVLGSTAERVVRLAPAPVLTVCARGLGPASWNREVLCPLGPEASAATLAFAGALARRSGSALSVLHVLENARGQDPAAWLDKIAGREWLSEVVGAVGEGVNLRPLVRAGRPSREILRAARERAVDVIVMGLHGPDPAERGLFARTVDQVVEEAECGVITVRSTFTGIAEAENLKAERHRACNVFSGR